jgi:hypothetical protein
MEKEKGYEPEVETIDIEDLETAREFIRECMEIKGDLPLVTVPIEYAEEARNGIKPHTTWIYDALIAGMLGRKPYMPGDVPRAVFRVKTKPEDVAPRFTGPDKHFHGVVIFKKPIPPDLLEEIPAQQ